VSATGDVTVSDGKLTIADNNGSQHALAYVDILLKTQKNSTTVSAPTSLVATARYSTQVDLRWIDNANNEDFDDGYIVERRTGAGAWTNITNVDGGVRQYAIDFYGVAANTTYDYRIKTRRTNTSGVVLDSAYSSIVTVTTPANDNQAAYGGTNWAVPGTIQAEAYDRGLPGDAFSDTTAANAGGFYRTGSVDIGALFALEEDPYYVGWIKNSEWQEYTVNVATTGNYYVIAKVSSPGAGGSWKVMVDGTDRMTGIAVRDTGGFENFTDQSHAGTFNLTSGNGRVFRFQATGEDASGKFVGNFDAFSLYRFDAPVVATPMAASSTQINLSWTNNHTGSGKNVVYRRIAGTTTWTELPVDIESFVTTYSDTGLTPATTYEYMVRGKRDVLGSSPVTSELTALSNIVSVTTPAASGVPAAPSALQAAANGSAVTLTWVDNSNNETSFVLERATNSLFTSPTQFNIGVNSVSYVDNAVAAGTPYWYRIRSINGANSSAWVSTTVTTSAFVTSNITPGDDAYVRSGTFASINYGNDVDLFAKQSSAGYERQAFIEVGLGSLSGTINSASLWLYARRQTAFESPLQFQVRAVADTTWTESGINFNNKPAIGATLATVTLPGNTAYQWYEINVLNYVAAEFAAGRTTVAFAVVGTATTDAYWQIKSSESTNAPYLRVTNTLLTAPPPPRLRRLPLLASLRRPRQVRAWC
jgi:hypothetical protein